MEAITEIPLTAKGKVKKPRSEAQINATRKALEILQSKRKEKWEQKKEEIITSAPPAPVAPVAPIAPVAPAPAPAPIAPVAPKDNIPDWAKVMYEKIEQLSTPKHKRRNKSEKNNKRRVIIEEDTDSSSSDEEVIIKRKKKEKVSPPPPTPTPVPQEKPINPLRQLLNRR